MKSIDTLIRLAKFEVDAKQRVLSALLDKDAELEAAIAAVDAEVAAEKAYLADHPDPAANFAAWRRRMLEKRATLVQDRQALGQVIDRARDDLAEAFESQKKYEITAENQEEEERREESRRDQEVLNEIALQAKIREGRL